MCTGQVQSKEYDLGMDTSLKNLPVELLHDGHELCYTYDTRSESTGITALLRRLQESGIHFNDLHTSQSSLEDIFVDLVRRTE